MSMFLSLFGFMFFFVFGFIVFVMFKMVKSGNAYKSQPRISAPAKLIETRTYVSNNFTYYYGTFEFNTGDRIEVKLPRDRAGLIVEGDDGELTFQGDMFIDFNQEIY